MKLAIVGASGAVGRTILDCLDEFQIDFSQLDLYASKKSAGSTMFYFNREYIIRELTHEIFSNKYDYVLFSAGGSVSREYAQTAVKHGSIVIDNSSAFRERHTSRSA
jgi:aspartate-semialdehyde dehydrogenase